MFDYELEMLEGDFVPIFVHGLDAKLVLLVELLENHSRLGRAALTQARLVTAQYTQPEQENKTQNYDPTRRSFCR